MQANTAHHRRCSHEDVSAFTFGPHRNWDADAACDDPHVLLRHASFGAEGKDKLGGSSDDLDENVELQLGEAVRVDRGLLLVPTACAEARLQLERSTSAEHVLQEIEVHNKGLELQLSIALQQNALLRVENGVSSSLIGTLEAELQRRCGTSLELAPFHRPSRYSATQLTIWSQADLSRAEPLALPHLTPSAALEDVYLQFLESPDKKTSQQTVNLHLSTICEDAPPQVPQLLPQHALQQAQQTLNHTCTHALAERPTNTQRLSSAITLEHSHQPPLPGLSCACDMTH